MTPMKIGTYGRNAKSVTQGQWAQLRVQIGHNTGTAERARFGAQKGLVIFRNSIGPDNRYPVAYALMGKLMSAQCRLDEQCAISMHDEMSELQLPEGKTWKPGDEISISSCKHVVTNQLKLGASARPFVLPQQIQVCLAGGARRDNDGDWDFPNWFDFRRRCLKQQGCKGLFCSGDGRTAERWQGDNAPKRRIACNPTGKPGVEPEEICPFSLPSERDGKNRPAACRAVMSANLYLFYTGQNGRLLPLTGDPSTSTALVKTTSEAAGWQWYAALSSAADRLNGWLEKLSATIAYSYAVRMTPHHAGGELKSFSGMKILLNELEIIERETQLRSSRGLEDEAPEKLRPQIEAPAVFNDEDDDHDLPGDEDVFDTEASPVESLIQHENGPPGDSPDVSDEIIEGVENAAIGYARWLRANGYEATESQVYQHIFRKKSGQPGPNGIEHVRRSFESAREAAIRFFADRLHELNERGPEAVPPLKEWKKVSCEQQSEEDATS